MDAKAEIYSRIKLQEIFRPLGIIHKNRKSRWTLLYVQNKT